MFPDLSRSCKVHVLTGGYKFGKVERWVIIGTWYSSQARTIYLETENKVREMIIGYSGLVAIEQQSGKLT